MAGYYGILSGVCPSVRTSFPDFQTTLFPDYFSYMLYPIGLKLGDIEHNCFEVTVHHILIERRSSIKIVQA